MHNGVQTLLVRVTEAGLKLLKLTGTGTTTVSITVAGDLNKDGRIDGTDSAAWESANAAQNLFGDLNGDGLVNQADRQILYANYGWQANLAPQAEKDAPSVMTHTDLAVSIPLDNVAQDYENDALFWQVVGATHGTAKLSSDGHSLIFTPEAGYSGGASVFVKADDGFNSSAPIQLYINVSAAKLLAIHVDRLAVLDPGAAASLVIHADFEDQQGVSIDSHYVEFTSSDPTVATIDVSGRLHGLKAGTAIVEVKAHGIDAINALAVGLNLEAPIVDGLANELDIFPPTFDLPAGIGQRQIDVHTFAAVGLGDDLSTAASGTQYFISNPGVASISADGLVIANASGTAVITVVNGGLQGTIHLTVQQATLGASSIKAATGGITVDTCTHAATHLLCRPQPVRYHTIPTNDVPNVDVSLWTHCAARYHMARCLSVLPMSGGPWRALPGAVG